MSADPSTPSPATVSILVDADAATPVAKGSTFAMPPGVVAVAQKVVQLGEETFTASVAGLVSAVASALDRVDLARSTYELADVKFSLSFDAKGEVSIVSLAKGTVAGKSGLEITLRRRSPA